MTQQRVTRAAINAEFQRRGVPLELEKGEGYCYFILDTFERAPKGYKPGLYETHSIMVCALGHQTFDRWIADGLTWAEQFKAETV